MTGQGMGSLTGIWGRGLGKKVKSSNKYNNKQNYKTNTLFFSLRVDQIKNLSKHAFVTSVFVLPDNRDGLTVGVDTRHVGRLHFGNHCTANTLHTGGVPFNLVIYCN